MFVRVKTTKNSPKKYVQIVASLREDNKVKQRIVRHIGYALDDDELTRLKDLATYILEKMKSETHPSLFAPEQLARMAIESRTKAKPNNAPLRVDLEKLREQSRIIVGIHDIYGSIYDELGFNKIIPPERKVKSARILKDIVMARIANPSSKRKNVADLVRDFGIKIDLSAVYRMMDHLQQPQEQDIQQKAFHAAKQLFPEPIRVLFYDCTTLYFESVVEDTLKSKGYSKDMKFNQSQVLLALMVTPGGLPVGYRLYKGNSFEGNTLKDAMEHMASLDDVQEVVFVADSAMLSKENIDLLKKHNQKYIVGARIKNLNSQLKKEIIQTDTYQQTSTEEESLVKIKTWQLDQDTSLIVSYSAKRARKDAFDRQQAIDRLEKKLNRSKDPIHLVSNYGYKKFLKSNAKGKVEVDTKKIAEAEKWDGLHGVITNKTATRPQEILSHYKGLWEVEETFRISKHDMKIRPIYHWTERRIHAHIALCFMALTCIRHLSYRVGLQYKKLSPEVIRNELSHQQLSILKHKETGKTYGIPSRKTTISGKVYQIMAKSHSDVPFAIK